VAELTLTFALALVRRIRELDSHLTNGNMIKSIDYVGKTLHGKVRNPDLEEGFGLDVAENAD
jgi:phosphoglycerate dehydrogenase-like enzyme